MTHPDQDDLPDDPEEEYPPERRKPKKREKEPDGEGWEDRLPIEISVAVFFAELFAVIWFFVTILSWLMNNSAGDNITLLQQFQRQCEFVKALRIW